ncbi:MAG TPA: acyltransferase [Lutibacter sp.]|nr:acyltransferase [Lutibacter sp.]
MLKTIILKLLVKYKYRNTKLKNEGQRCQYKFLNSNFSYANNISLKEDVHIGKGADFDGAGGISIGNGVIFAPDVCIYSRTHNFDSDDLQALPFDNVVLTSKVIIKDYVWVGRGAIILPGVIVGKGVIIGAGAIVSKNIPDYAIVVGNPAKVVKYRNKEKFEELLSLSDPFVYTKLGHQKILREKS